MATFLPSGGAVRRCRGARSGAGRIAADPRAPHERQSARQRRAASPGPASPRPSRVRGRGGQARHGLQRGHARPRDLPSRRHRREPVELPPVRPGRGGIEPARLRVRGDRPAMDGRDAAHRRSPCAFGARHGGPLRASLPGLARRLPVDRPARAVQLLRGVHPHHRLDVQPARQVAEDDRRDPVAPTDRVTQLPLDQPRLAAGPQWLQPPGTPASSTTW